MSSYIFDSGQRIRGVSLLFEILTKINRVRRLHIDWQRTPHDSAILASLYTRHVRCVLCAVCVCTPFYSICFISHTRRVFFIFISIFPFLICSHFFFGWRLFRSIRIAFVCRTSTTFSMHCVLNLVYTQDATLRTAQRSFFSVSLPLVFFSTFSHSPSSSAIL